MPNPAGTVTLALATLRGVGGRIRDVLADGAVQGLAVGRLARVVPDHPNRKVGRRVHVQGRVGVQRIPASPFGAGPEVRLRHRACDLDGLRAVDPGVARDRELPTGKRLPDVGRPVPGAALFRIELAVAASVRRESESRCRVPLMAPVVDLDVGPLAVDRCGADAPALLPVRPGEPLDRGGRHESGLDQSHVSVVAPLHDLGEGRAKGIFRLYDHVRPGEGIFHPLDYVGGGPRLDRRSGALPGPGRGDHRGHGHRRGPTGQRRPGYDPPVAPVRDCLTCHARWNLYFRGEPVQSFTDQLFDVPVHGLAFVSLILVLSAVFVSCAGSPPGSCHVVASSRSRRSPRDAADLTVPSEQPSSTAVSASVRCSQ